jgi:hypothetical protein
MGAWLVWLVCCLFLVSAQASFHKKGIFYASLVGKRCESEGIWKMKLVNTVVGCAIYKSVQKFGVKPVPCTII